MSRMIAVILVSMFMLPGLMAQKEERLMADYNNQYDSGYQEYAVAVSSDAVTVNSVNTKRMVAEAVQEEQFETENWMKDTDTWGTPVLSNASDNISESDMKVETWMKSAVSFENAASSEVSLKLEDWMVCNSAW